MAAGCPACVFGRLFQIPGGHRWITPLMLPGGAERGSVNNHGGSMASVHGVKLNSCLPPGFSSRSWKLAFMLAPL